MAGQLVLLDPPAWLPPGLLTGAAWDLLRAAEVRTRSLDHPWAAALTAAGIPVTAEPHPEPAVLLAADLVWLVDAEQDKELVAQLGAAATVQRFGDPGIPTGSRLLEVVRVMDRLRSPGGCPWDAEQDHRSLAPYLLEEAYEAVDAIESADAEHLLEELGDVLLQVVFHARVATERPAGFDIDDVAAGLVDKLVRRHPHVFGDDAAPDAGGMQQRWDELKAAEKGRTSPADGVALGQPAAALAGKLYRRARRAGVDVAAFQPTGPGAPLWSAVVELAERGVEPEAALRGVARQFRDQLAGLPARQPASGIVPP